MNTPGDRLKAARERAGFPTAKDAALAMGVPIATYTQHEKAQHHFPGTRAKDYADFFGLTPEYLQFGRGVVPDRIAILNREGEPTGRTVAMPPPPSMLTQAVEGDGIAYFGMVAIYDEPTSSRGPRDFLNRLCVVSVQIDNMNHRIIRIVQKGTKEDHFHLIGGQMPMIDQPVQWIAPVTALVPV